MSPEPLHPDRIYHITTRDAWQMAQGIGRYEAPSLATEGFIHCSYAHQVPETAVLYYQGQTGLLLLEIQPGCLSAPLKHEPSRQGQHFPHLYGALNLDAVVRTLSITANGEVLKHGT
jgi:uncharacterized protein (DUF952 family)